MDAGRRRLRAILEARCSSHWQTAVPFTDIGCQQQDAVRGSRQIAEAGSTSFSSPGRRSSSTGNRSQPVGTAGSTSLQPAVAVLPEACSQQSAALPRAAVSARIAGSLAIGGRRECRDAAMPRQHRLVSWYDGSSLAGRCGGGSRQPGQSSMIDGSRFAVLRERRLISTLSFDTFCQHSPRTGSVAWGAQRVGVQSVRWLLSQPDDGLSMAEPTCVIAEQQPGDIQPERCRRTPSFAGNICDEQPRFIGGVIRQLN